MTPARIVSLLASATEILYEVGAGPRVVGVSHECDWPADVLTKPRVTRTRVDDRRTSQVIDNQVREMLAAGEPLYEIDTELLGSLAPDLIVTQSQCDVCAVRQADVLAAVAADPRLTHTRVVDLHPHRLADILLDIERVGTIAGCAARARDLVDELEARIDSVAERTLGIPLDDRPRVACLEWLDPLMLAANWIPELLRIAGGRSPLVAEGEHSGYARWADVREFDPEVVVLMPCGFDLARTLAEAPVLAPLPGWAELSAARQGRVWAVDGNALFNRSGPRMIESLELLAHLVRPDVHPWPASIPSEAPVCARVGGAN